MLSSTTCDAAHTYAVGCTGRNAEKTSDWIRFIFAFQEPLRPTSRTYLDERCIATTGRTAGFKKYLNNFNHAYWMDARAVKHRTKIRVHHFHPHFPPPPWVLKNPGGHNKASVCLLSLSDWRNFRQVVVTFDIHIRFPHIWRHWNRDALQHHMRCSVHLCSWLYERSEPKCWETLHFKSHYLPFQGRTWANDASLERVGPPAWKMSQSFQSCFLYGRKSSRIIVLKRKCQVGWISFREIF